jgi:hypothetical protein
MIVVFVLVRIILTTTSVLQIVIACSQSRRRHGELLEKVFVSDYYESKKQ